jgi:tetratricopeptide (TPR) repeat protein
MMDLHDFAAAEATLTKIQTDASDFPASPVLSAIREAEQTSNLALLSAKQALLTNNSDDAKDALQKAIQIWPMNPEIKKLQEQVASRLDVMDQMTPQFDELLKEQSYRTIYDKKSDFGMAFINDPDRANQLRDIVERVGRIDMLVAYANEALAQNNGFVAWETLANAAKLDANDPVLARTQAQVAPRVANFVSALDSAQRAEQAGQYAASLNDYLAAQDIYPASQLCRLGIDNVSKQILAKMNPGGQSAKLVAAQEAADAAAKAAAAAATAPAPTAAPATQSPAATTDNTDMAPANATPTTGTRSPTAATNNNTVLGNTGLANSPATTAAQSAGIPRTLF